MLQISVAALLVASASAALICSPGGTYRERQKNQNPGSSAWLSPALSAEDDPDGAVVMLAPNEKRVYLGENCRAEDFTPSSSFSPASASSLFSVSPRSASSSPVGDRTALRLSDRSISFIADFSALSCACSATVSLVRVVGPECGSGLGELSRQGCAEVVLVSANMFGWSSPSSRYAPRSGGF